MKFLKILSSSQIKAWDAFTINTKKISSIDLMETAAAQCVEWLVSEPLLNYTEELKIFCGTGNNGGDGLAIARMLSAKGYKPAVYILPGNDPSADFNTNLQRLKKTTTPIKEIGDISQFTLSGNDYIIDALLGSGLNKPLAGLMKQTVEKINASSAHVISIDMPTGFPSSPDAEISVAVNADYTLTFQVPKLRMLFPESYDYTGELKIVDIGLSEEFNLSEEGDYYFLTAPFIKKIVNKRKKFDHKGTFGHALLLAGSYGKMGAAVLSGKACLRSGVGLLTMAVPESGNEIVQISVPEAMTYTLEEYEKYVTSFPKIKIFKSIGIGPGLEKKPVTRLMLKNLLVQPDLPPLIIDADGLNMLAETLKETPDFKIPENTILTPHVKEFERLAGLSGNSIERHYKQMEFSKKHKVYVVLKGAYTAISTPEGDCYFNSTGNPGMATGGSGDVLTGVLAGLRAQGYSPLETCLLGIYIHGSAGDLAAETKGEYSLLASDIIDQLGPAFKNLGV